MSVAAATEWLDLQIPFPSAVTQLSEPPPTVVSLLELERPSDGDTKTLLGNRFLCRRGGLVRGFLGRLLFHHGGGFVQTSSWIGSIVGAIIALLIYMQLEQRRGSRV